MQVLTVYSGHLFVYFRWSYYPEMLCVIFCSTSSSLGHDKGLNINPIQAILLISCHAMQKTPGKSLKLKLVRNTASKLYLVNPLLYCLLHQKSGKINSNLQQQQKSTLNFHLWTHVAFFWPILCTRPMACSSWAGLRSGSICKMALTQRQCGECSFTRWTWEASMRLSPLAPRLIGMRRT